MPGLPIRFGRQVCGSLEEAASREWLVADGLGGFAMGTVAGLRTRRYHGLLVVATQPPIGRRLGLASLDPVLVLRDRRVRLAVHEWAGGAVDPEGYVHLATFELVDGVPRWRWAVGDVVLEREVAMVRGRPAVAVVHRVVRAPGPVRLELSALCAWRDVHGERFADGDPFVERTAGGFVFEGAYRVAGPEFEPGGQWYRGARYRVEAERGLDDREDLWFAGAFAATLEPGEDASVTAWAGDLAEVPPPAPTVVAAARKHARDVVARSAAVDEVDAALAMAADQFVVSGPTVVAGYPWFGDWSRDTMTSYEGLLLETRRFDEGRTLLLRAAASLSAGMLANTADVGGAPEYNTADATLWFLHAVGRHVEATGDDDLAATLAPALEEVVERHVAGTRYGIGVDRSDGLLTQGAPGVALTWMDARVEGRPVTQRQGKAVEINALWINGLAMLATLQERVGRDSCGTRSLEETARASFARRFVRRGQVLDVVHGPAGDRAEVRPNQLLAVSLPHGPLRATKVVRACAPLLTSLGPRSLAPLEPGYTGRHRGGPAERDAAYHQGTVWPWLIGPYVEAALRTGVDVAGVLDGLEAHLSEWGLGSVSETADGDPPHAATGCPFQAWSVDRAAPSPAVTRAPDRVRLPPAPPSARSRPPAGRSARRAGPAATKAAPVAWVMVPISMPIWVAATMNGSDVAWSRPAATTRRGVAMPRYTSAGSPRTTTRATRNSGTRRIVDAPENSAPPSNAMPLRHEEHRDKEPVADPLQLQPEVGVGHHGVAVHQPQDHAGHERAEDGLQAEPLGQRDEPDQEHHRAPHPDLLAEPEWKPAYIIRGLRDLRVSL